MRRTTNEPRASRAKTAELQTEQKTGDDWVDMDPTALGGTLLDKLHIGKVLGASWLASETTSCEHM